MVEQVRVASLSPSYQFFQVIITVYYHLSGNYFLFVGSTRDDDDDDDNVRRLVDETSALGEGDACVRFKFKSDACATRTNCTK